MRRSWGRELAETVLLTALIFFGVRSVVQSFRVDGPSMLPSLESDQLLMVNKAVYWRTDQDSPLASVAQGEPAGDDDRFLFHQPQHGDVIVFEAPKDPGRDYIKRVIGVPGDVIRIRDGGVWRNGRRLREPYIGDTVTEADGYTAGEDAWRVPRGQLFVLGDNRLGSSDSRAWGYVPMENVIGKAIFTYWPAGEWGGVPAAALLHRGP